MDFIKYINGTSGSKGNCHLLSIESSKTAILLDIGKPFNYIKGLIDELDFDIENLIILVTHHHTDHYKAPIYKKLLMTYANVNIQTILNPKDKYVTMADDLNRLVVSFIPCTHGSVTSLFFVINYYNYVFDTKEKVLYCTDIDSLNMKKLLGHDTLMNADLALIEANYDERYLMDSIMNPEQYTAFGYDVTGGFTRHLSKQMNEQLIESLQPKENMQIHQSHRFFEWKE